MQDKDGNIIKYLLGWVFAPAYTIQNLPHWQPVDAVDACHAKYPGQGTFYVRATLDADRHTHALTIAHFLSSESTWGWRNFFKHESQAYNDDEFNLNSKGRCRVVKHDGDPSSLYCALLLLYCLVLLFYLLENCCSRCDGVQGDNRGWRQVLGH